MFDQASIFSGEVDALFISLRDNTWEKAISRAKFLLGQFGVLCVQILCDEVVFDGAHFGVVSVGAWIVGYKAFLSCVLLFSECGCVERRLLHFGLFYDGLTEEAIPSLWWISFSKGSVHGPLSWTGLHVWTHEGRIPISSWSLLSCMRVNISGLCSIWCTWLLHTLALLRIVTACKFHHISQCMSLCTRSCILSPINKAIVSGLILDISLLSILASYAKRLLLHPQLWRSRRSIMSYSCHLVNLIWI